MAVGERLRADQRAALGQTVEQSGRSRLQAPVHEHPIEGPAAACLGPFAMPSAAKRACAASARLLNRSTPATSAQRCDSTAVAYPLPEPISRTR